MTGATLPTLRLTLYELFGYAVPGTVFLAALVLLYWAIYLPAEPLVLYLQTSTTLLILGLLLAHLCGHVAQAFANLVAYRDATLIAEVPTSLVNAAMFRLRYHLGIIDLTPELVCRLCEEFLIQKGASEAREIYVYHEGFYRGMGVSFSAISVALSVRVLRPGTAIRLPSGIYYLPTSALALLLIACIITTVLLWLRYHRFAHRRILAPITAFLALQVPKADGHPTGGL